MGYLLLTVVCKMMANMIMYSSCTTCTLQVPQKEHEDPIII
jgi:hypothetical protein